MNDIPGSEQPRRILLEPNIARPDIVATVAQVVDACAERGIAVRVLEDTRDRVATGGGVECVPDTPAAAEGCELVLVLGGDGTFLRACQYAHAADVPVLGVNLGHIGFLAESEVSSLSGVVEQIAARDYRVVERMTVEATVINGETRLAHDWALNEVSIEKVARQGVLEASVEIDGRPVSDYGCDGMLVSTPTGSTAYAFSAGGPIVWPELDAILVVPNNAHALFARPMVVAPTSRVAVETGVHSGPAVVVLDGRRLVDAPPGSRVEVVRGRRPVKWVRLDDSPFTDRLVTKFELPVTGWRGRSGVRPLT
ncbi:MULTISPECIES: NAD kinase [Dietzia]|uniref:NAD kinase n=1 Tax=Dietzia cinnamea TaxID=321318 RepID=A0A4R3ZQB6_9ACTN|nr:MULTISPECIES: NAD kinase [Dietzia]AVM65147.1 NAD kinase [Dietzia sp. oral taxon 368]MCT1712211.1 NAD kinase [Dietzia cinnamea]MCT2265106.1 NAD kinase [Dietzia cinnamea]MCT2274891.1 NAD kinase [Dietzia cinnamea]TCW21252.1 NAD+ kinase [Dietzia cinnamea]